MEMTLNLPRNYVEIEEEEMMYLDGGKRYSGGTGWAAVAALYVGGGAIAAIGGISSVAIMGACLQGGPIGWVAGALMAGACYGVAAIGRKFYNAGAKAAYYMMVRGYFHLNSQKSWSKMLVVS